jgi:hypothetical protein
MPAWGKNQISRTEWERCYKENLTPALHPTRIFNAGIRATDRLKVDLGARDSAELGGREAATGCDSRRRGIAIAGQLSVLFPRV